MTQTVKHENHTIKLTDDLEFQVTGELFGEEDRSTFASLREAKAAINEAVELAARAKVKARTTKIQVLDEAGEIATITGINRSSRQLTGLKRDRDDYVYPNIPWVKTALQELEKLEAEVRSRRKQLNSVCVSAKRGYGHISPIQYDGIVDAFEKEMEQKTKQAAKGPPALVAVSKTKLW